MLNPDELTPGIRHTVIWLRALGFETTDSGDGIANVAAGMLEAMDFPNVAMVVEPHKLLGEASRLMALLVDAGIHVEAQGLDPKAVSIQAMFDPADESATLLLMGVDDSLLFASSPAP